MNWKFVLLALIGAIMTAALSSCSPSGLKNSSITFIETGLDSEEGGVIDSAGGDPHTSTPKAISVLLEQLLPMTVRSFRRFELIHQQYSFLVDAKEKAAAFDKSFGRGRYQLLEQLIIGNNFRPQPALNLLQSEYDIKLVSQKKACPAKDKKHHAMSVSKDGVVCVSKDELAKLPAESLAIEATALLIHEISHLYGFEESAANEIQKLFTEHKDVSKDFSLAISGVISQLENIFRSSTGLRVAIIDQLGLPLFYAGAETDVCKSITKTLAEMKPYESMISLEIPLRPFLNFHFRQAVISLAKAYGFCDSGSDRQNIELPVYFSEIDLRGTKLNAYRDTGLLVKSISDFDKHLRNIEDFVRLFPDYKDLTKKWIYSATQLQNAASQLVFPTLNELEALVFAKDKVLCTGQLKSKEGKKLQFWSHWLSEFDEASFVDPRDRSSQFLTWEMDVESFGKIIIQAYTSDKWPGLRWLVFSQEVEINFKEIQNGFVLQNEERSVEQAHLLMYSKIYPKISLEIALSDRILTLKCEEPND